MKKIFVILGVCIALLGCKKAMADVILSEELKKIPAIHQLILFNITDSKIEYASSVTLVQLFNKTTSIDIGWSPSQELLGLVSVKLVEVKDYLDYPILRWIVLEPFISYGFDRIENFKELGEGNLGVGAKLISIKFN